MHNQTTREDKTCYGINLLLLESPMEYDVLHVWLWTNGNQNFFVITLLSLGEKPDYICFSSFWRSNMPFPVPHYLQDYSYLHALQVVAYLLLFFKVVRVILVYFYHIIYLFAETKGT